MAVGKSFPARISAGVKSTSQRVTGNGLVKFITRVVAEFGEDKGTNLAAAVAFYAFISLFPLLLAAIGLAGLFLKSPELQERLFSYLSSNIPGSQGVLQENIRNVIEARGTLGIIGVAGFLWTGSSLMAAAGQAVNLSWNINKEIQFYWKKLRDIGLTLGLGILFILSLGASAFLAVGPMLDIPFLGSFLARAGAAAVALLLSFVIFLVLFKVMPNTKTNWRHIWFGAFVTAVLFEAGRTVTFLYLTRFTNYEAVYGSLASVVSLLLWLYYSAVILVLGAELTSEYSRMRRGVGRGTHSHSIAKPAKA